MWVTLYTDASYSLRAGGGWAFWARSDRGRLVDHGMCPDFVTDPNMAEMWAIKQGVEGILDAWGPGVQGIHTKTDSQTAISVLKYRARTPRRKAYRRLQDLVRELLDPDTKMKMSWVKSHQKSDDIQAWLNNKVDELSRLPIQAVLREKGRLRHD